jgi:UDP-N-acetylmuramoylalanine--D-glutamate ligase
MRAIDEYPEYSSSGLKVLRAEHFADAVSMAHREAREGESVILSPACASFDAFKNFDQRGKVFKKAVLDLK